MGKEEKKLMRRRLANAYLSSIISISMVLLLVGIASLLIVNARSVTDYFKENLQISVLLKQEVSESAAEACMHKVEAMPYIHQARVVSREEGTEELKAMLGEDFLCVRGIARAHFHRSHTERRVRLSGQPGDREVRPRRPTGSG